MMRRRRFFATLILFLSLSVSTSFQVNFSSSPSLLATTAKADDNCLTFSNSTHQICGKYLTYWNTHGGLAQQGLPISDVLEERNAPAPAGDGQLHRVQYFERARFELHEENQPPYDVLLGLLGTEQLKAKYQNVPPGVVTNQPGCFAFSQTGYEVCGKFFEYWQSHGGLEQQGLPISRLGQERNAPPPAGDGKIHIVQYFERARFELHDENTAPYDVLLGLLGTEQYALKYQSGSPNNGNGSGGGAGQPTQSPAPTPSPTPIPAPTTVNPGQPSPTPVPQPTLTPTPTAAPTPTQTPKPAPAPASGSGCLPTANPGETDVQACVSNSSPSQNSTVTVYSRMLVNGQAVSGASMSSTWNYKTTTSGCSATAGSDGVAACSRDISRATKGYTVYIDVSMSGGGQSLSGSTSFTPR